MVNSGIVIGTYNNIFIQWLHSLKVDGDNNIKLPKTVRPFQNNLSLFLEYVVLF